MSARAPERTECDVCGQEDSAAKSPGGWRFRTANNIAVRIRGKQTHGGGRSGPRGRGARAERAVRGALSTDLPPVALFPQSFRVLV